MKPILRVETLMVYQDDKGNIFEHTGITPFRNYLVPNRPDEKHFNSLAGDYTVRAELVIDNDKHEI